jgi:hypothetical protein
MHRLPILLTPQATDLNGNQILNASQPMKLYIFPDGNEEEKPVSINMNGTEYSRHRHYHRT